MLTALTTIATVSTVTTIRTSVSTLSTLTTFRALTALTTFAGRTLLITFGLLNQYTVGKLVFACLRVNLQQFYLNLVTLFDTSLLDSLKALPVNL